MKFPKHGKDAGDHPPITPTNKVASGGQLGGVDWKIYEFVCRHFLGTIGQDASFSKKKAEFVCGNHEFSINGSSMTDKGFTEIMPWITITDQIIPDFKIGQKVLVGLVDVKTGMTTPPDHLTESELISLMEKHGIGTDASMATHINNVCERNYVTVASNRKLKPTELGINLVHGYQSIDPELVAPTLRGNIERSCDLIAQVSSKKGGGVIDDTNEFVVLTELFKRNTSLHIYYN